jgi:hypothetical protein
MLRAEERHVRQHRHGVDRRRTRLRRQHVLVALTDEWLLRERRAKVICHAVQDAACRPAQSRVSLVAGLRQRGGSGFTQQRAATLARVLVHAGLAKLEEERRIVILREQPEEDTPRVQERWRILVPPVFHEPAHGRNRPDTLERIALPLWHRKHPAGPRAVRRLLHSQQQGWFVCKG